MRRTNSKASGDTAHNDGDEVVEVTVSWGSKLEGSETDVVESLVVDAEGLVRVLDQLVNRKGSVVRLDNGVRNLKKD